MLESSEPISDLVAAGRMLFLILTLEDHLKVKALTTAYFFLLFSTHFLISLSSLTENFLTFLKFSKTNVDRFFYPFLSEGSVMF